MTETVFTGLEILVLQAVEHLIRAKAHEIRKYILQQNSHVNNGYLYEILEKLISKNVISKSAIIEKNARTYEYSIIQNWRKVQ